MAEQGEPMRRLWAPWRLPYIENADRSDDCFLCTYPAAGRDTERFILARNDQAFAILNAFPYSNGHVLIAPYNHIADLDELTPEETLAIWDLATRCIGALRKALNPHGHNLGINLGRAAGAGLEGHIHLHIVPRWNGDTNFMATVAETRVIPASLEAMYDRLKEHLRE